MFRGKNYKESAKLIDKQALYDPMEALNLVISASKAKFDETVELHVKLGVDGRHADQQVRGAIVLPNGTGSPSASCASASRSALKRLSQPAVTTQAAWISSRRSRRRTGLSSIPLSPAPT